MPKVHEVLVVFDVESEEPFPLGVYVDTTEDIHEYRTAGGEYGYALQDVVKVVMVRVEV